MKRFAHRMLLCLLLTVPLELRGQVDICYTFETTTFETFPTGWSAIPSLDSFFTRVPWNDPYDHSGSRALACSYHDGFIVMPDEGLDYAADSVWLQFWYLGPYSNTVTIRVGYLTDTTDTNSFHQLAVFLGWRHEWHHCAVDLTGVPVGARIAFSGFTIGMYSAVYYLDDLHLTSSPCAMWGLEVEENGADSVRVGWQSVGNPSLTLTVGDSVWHPVGNSFSFAREPDSTYLVALTALLDTTVCGMRPLTEQVIAFSYKESCCPDVTDFGSTKAVPYYGTPLDPYMFKGTYAGSYPGLPPGQNGDLLHGTHWLRRDNTPEVGYGLEVFRTFIPPGDSVVLRLGNRSGREVGEAVLYTIAVDTNQADLLVLKYTLGMSPPSTEARYADNPAWFSVELMDENMNLLSPEGCCRTLVKATDSSGWDWNTVMARRRNYSSLAFDLSSYHGRRVHLRVTMVEGAGNYWCYGFYNLSCRHIWEEVSGCGSDGSVSLAAPWGFNYRWYRHGDTIAFDTAQTITVPADGTLWHCDLSNRFNTDCIVTIDRQVHRQPTLTMSDTVVENALPYIFMGETFVSGIDTSFVKPGSGGCDTLVRFRLHVWPHQTVRDVRRVCPDEWPVEWEGLIFSHPDSGTVTLLDVHGADSTVTLVLDSSFSARAFHSSDGIQWADTAPIVICSNQHLFLSDSTLESSAWRWNVECEGWNKVENDSYADFSFDGVDSLTRGNVVFEVVTGGCADTLRWPLVVLPSPRTGFEWFPQPVDLAPETEFTNLSEPADNVDFLWLVQRERGGTEVDSIALAGPFRYRWEGDLPQGDFDVELQASLDYDFLLDSVKMHHVCTDTARRTVTIFTSYLQFPNLVTPNGDGINDRWRIVNLLEYGLYSMNELWIYSRWGDLVYHVRDIHEESQFWDPSNPFCPDGTYFYRFSAKSLCGLVRLNGVIEVVR